MKELSTEQKAIAYDKVREKIAARFGSNVADEIFSQFEESEDERIRKALLKWFLQFKQNDMFNDDISFKDILAWLEKQHKKDEEILILKDQIESLHAARKALIEVHKIELKKQDEQWSEEDESMYIRTLGILGKCYMGELPTKVEEELNWFKSLKDRVQPQPRQEWSEEDEEALEEVQINFEINKGKMTPALQECYDRFFDKIKTLNPYLEKEWSEEDESTINDIICYIRQRLNYESEKGKKKIQKCENWLKSLRPQNNATDEELTQAKKNAYNDALDKIEYHSEEPTFDDGWDAAIWYLKKRNTMPQSQWKPTDNVKPKFLV